MAIKTAKRAFVGAVMAVTMVAGCTTPNNAPPFGGNNVQESLDRIANYPEILGKFQVAVARITDNGCKVDPDLPALPHQCAWGRANQVLLAFLELKGIIGDDDPIGTFGHVKTVCEKLYPVSGLNDTPSYARSYVIFDNNPEIYTTFTQKCGDIAIEYIRQLTPLIVGAVDAVTPAARQSPAPR